MSENELVQLAISGDEGAFRKLWKGLELLARRVIQKHIDSPDDRAEVLNDCRMAIWMSLPTFKAESKLSTWAYSICTNLCLKYYRDRVAGEEDVERIGDFHDVEYFCEKFQPELDYGFQSLSTLLEKRLSKDNLQILLDMAEGGYTIREIAAKYKLSKSDVQRRLNAAKKKIKKTLLENYYEMQEL